jgi:hypothetical protein
MVRESIHNAPPAPKRATAAKTESRKSARLAAVSDNAFAAPHSKKNTNSALPTTLGSTVSAPVVETLEDLAERLAVLRDGARFNRPISLFHGPFVPTREGELRAWSRILGPDEALCVENTNPVHPRGADVIVDAERNPHGSALSVVFLSMELTAPVTSAPYALGMRVEVERRFDGTAFVAIRDIPPGSTAVFSNAPAQVLAHD